MYRRFSESFNGTNWTEENDLNTARQRLGASQTSYTDTLAFGGYTSTEVAVTENWNGVSWVETSDMNTARTEVGRAGATSTSALVFAGQTGSPNVRTGATEEFTKPSDVIKTLTD